MMSNIRHDQMDAVAAVGRRLDRLLCLSVGYVIVEKPLSNVHFFMIKFILFFK